MQYFKQDEIGEIFDAATRAALFAQRPALFAGINRYWTAGIEEQPNKTSQLLYDINALNTAELNDGSVPMDTWLGNAALLTRALKEGEFFLAIQIKLRGLTRQQAPVPDHNAVPEAGKKLEKPERVIVSDDRLPFTWLIGGVRTGASVLKLEVPRHERGASVVRLGEPRLFGGTGWVLAPGVVITCHHVIEAREYDEPAAAAADFEAQALATRMLVGYDGEGVVATQLTVSQLLFADRALDVALLEIRERTPTLEPLTLKNTRVELGADEKLSMNIIQHPEGKAKRLGFRNNLLSGADQLVLRYFTDTDPGSSGAPVCDDAWRVVGIHRAAVETKATRLGDGVTTYVNTGHQIAAVLEALSARADLWKRIEPGLRLA